VRIHVQHTRLVSNSSSSCPSFLSLLSFQQHVFEQADIIIWDLLEAEDLLEAGEVMIGDRVFVHRLKQHLTRVQDLSFSCDGQYLASMGSQDDNSVVVWVVKDGVALCGSPAGPDSGLVVKWLNGRNDRFVSAGNFHMRVWQIDFHLPKLHAVSAKLGSVQRIITSVAVEPDDHYAYCGTSTGDMIKVKIDRDELRSFNDPDTLVPAMCGVTKERFAKGVRTIQCVHSDTGRYNMIIGAGDGTIVYVNPSLVTVGGLKTQLMGGITSISQHPKGNKFMVGTDQSNRYELTADLASASMKASCHFGAINDVTYPEGCPELIVTASKGDIRVWNTEIRQELLRIQVPNLEAVCAQVTPSGTTLISGWNDGKVRAFYPESGRMKFVISDAHSEKVTAIACADNDMRGKYRLITGGDEGRVRVWDITPSHQAMVVSLKEHRGAVNNIKVNKDSTQAVTASSDGSCIVWDLDRYVRIVALFESNIFNNILYHPDESQMLTCGSNHKITYWDAVDGTAIRVIDGGEGVMTSLDVTASGEFFVSGCEDKMLKVWHYDEGLPMAIGYGHSGSIKAVKISPDERTIVSVGTTGEIIFWEMPHLGDMRELAASP
jgi:WD40 repeat protein